MIAYCGGVFDLWHNGHSRLCRTLKERGFAVTISLNTDEFSARYKRPPVLTLPERIEAAAACRWVDRVIVNHGDEDSRKAILDSKATHVVHGDDWTGDALMEQMGFDQAWLDYHGIKMLVVPYTPGISTGEVIRRCASRS